MVTEDELIYIWFQAPFNVGRFFKVKAKAQPEKRTPQDNLSTLMFFIIGLLLSVFILVGNFGAIGFLPFAMLVIGVIITYKFNIKYTTVRKSGFTTKTLILITGGLVLVLAINFIFSVALNVAFLQPPISQAALLASAQYANLPIYIYTLLFAISETYLFQGVILYWILMYVPNPFVAIGGSSLLWMTFHLFVYGETPLVLAFIFFTGLILGFITVETRNVLAATTIHGVNNLVAAGLTVAKVTSIIGVLI
jgi:membrane protease YdiL (CAAX protease family)